MTLAIWFWLIMALWFIGGMWWAWPGAPQTPYHGWFPLGSTVLLFILFFLLGWHSFGPPIRG